MAQFRVLYDFSAVEEGELSVRSGQVVVLKGALGPCPPRLRSLSPPPPPS